MASTIKKKLFLFIFCLASITQGMYSTYFVSILTTIEHIYQIQSKTAGAILSATEIGQILGSLSIAYYGGRGNKPKWISLCMTFSALAALISISPHFLLAANNNGGSNSSNIDIDINHIDHLDNQIYNQNQSPPALPPVFDHRQNISVTIVPDLSNLLAQEYSSSQSSSSPSPISIQDDLPNLPDNDYFCRISLPEKPATAIARADKSTHNSLFTAKLKPLSTDYQQAYQQQFPVSIIMAIFFTCLLAIGFGSTAITTLGIPFMDDIISKEESPLYLGMTIGLKILGPALGFLLGSYCIQLDSNSILPGQLMMINSGGSKAWWLGLILISVPLLILAIPMYFISMPMGDNDSEHDDYEDITYQAAEDHDIGGSNDFPAYNLHTNGRELDVTSSGTCFSSEVSTSSSREVLQACQSSPGQYKRYNYNSNMAFEQTAWSVDTILTTGKSKRLSFANDNDSQDNRDGLQACYTSEDGNSDWHSQNVCLVVNHFGGLEATSFNGNHDERVSKISQQNATCLPPSTASRSSVASVVSSYATSNAPKENDRRRNKQTISLQQPQPQARQHHQQHDILAISNSSSSLGRLIKNRLLVLRMLSAVLHIMPIAGFYFFLPKYLIEQFRITSSKASLISGLAGVLFNGFGAFIGGTLIRVFNVNSKIMTRWIAASALFYTIGMLVLMNLSCQENRTIHYNSLEFRSTDCFDMCHCSSTVFNPVCANSTTYLSPCLAGCRSLEKDSEVGHYGGCGCSASRVNLVGFGGTNLHTNKTDFNTYIAARGVCKYNCNNLIWYVIIFSIFNLIHASSEVGSVMFNLRCVNSNDRTLALGLITFTSSLFGLIPCSIIYGSIVDYTCIFWSVVDALRDSEGGDNTTDYQPGACRAYNNDLFRYYLHGLTAFVMFLAFFVDCIISRRANEVDFYEGKDDSRTDIRMGLKKSTESI